ncbi:MAG: hydrogenase formation protein HypD [Candidatus Hydrogenedentota bacterium]
MKYVDEYRDRAAAQRLVEAISRTVTRPHTLMEICGGQTHAIVKFGIDTLLPPEITLVHGPGCPVCVTPVAIVDRAIALARLPEVTLCSFGDMLRVPGSTSDLMQAKAQGGDVRMVYGPLDAVAIAREEPERQVVFFAIGFETTAPANALAVQQAKQLGLDNFSILCAQVRVPPAMEAILSGDACRVTGFLAAGHVCTVMGYTQYEPIAPRYGVPIVVTGFEPVDILRGIYQCVRLLEAGAPEVVNAYPRSVHRDGNPHAKATIDTVFMPIDQRWRGLGHIPGSGLGLRPEWGGFDATQRFDLTTVGGHEDPRCISGQILQGLKRPSDCPAFGTPCTPENPLGAPMVSNEGACAAYYRYRRTV